MNSIASVSGGSRQHGDNESASGFFLYAGGTVVIPDNVIHIRINPSVTTLPRKAFNNLPQLREVSLHEGIVEIKEKAFMNCHSPERINDIPPSLSHVTNFTRPHFHRIKYFGDKSFALFRQSRRTMLH